MEAEKIISTLKEQVGTTDFSDRTIGVYVENNPLAEGVEPDEEYFKKGATFLRSLQGQYNADFSSKLNAKVEEFKKNYKPTTDPPTPPTPPTDPTQSTNDFEARLKAMEDANNAKLKELEDKLSAKEKASEQKSYISQLEGKFKSELEEKGLIFDPIYFEHIVRENEEFDTQKSLDEAIKNVSEKYDKMFKDRNRQISTNGFAPQFQTSEQHQEGAKSAAEQYKERMRAEGRLPKVE